MLCKSVCEVLIVLCTLFDLYNKEMTSIHIVSSKIITTKQNGINFSTSSMEVEFFDSNLSSGLFSYSRIGRTRVISL